MGPLLTTAGCLRQGDGGGHSSEQRRRASGTQPRPVVMEVALPWLDGISIVDTPGTNAIELEHAAITHAMIPKCDLVMPEAIFSDD